MPIVAHGRAGTRIALVLLLATVAATGACSQKAESITAGECTLWSVKVSPASATLHPGDALLASAVTNPCLAADPAASAAFVWTSSDSTVSAVDSATGLVHARRTGSATIIARNSANHFLEGAIAVNVAP